MEEARTDDGTGPGREACNWSIAAHLGPIALSLVSLGILGWLIPLTILLTQKGTMPFAAEHARESLNFRLTLLILYVVSLPLMVLLICLGIPFWICIWLAEIVISIMAAVRASEGRAFRYPLTLRLVT